MLGEGEEEEEAGGEVETLTSCVGGGVGISANMNINMNMNMSNLKMKDERVPQWSHQETRDFIAVRAELERDFALTKRNKTLWEAVASKMKEMGYKRTPDQCKCKWKNLVNRYKGKETSDPENGRQCPFFEELHAVFAEREKNMQRLLLESEMGPTQARKRARRMIAGDRSSDEFSEDEEEDLDDSEEERPAKGTNPRKRKAERERPKQLKPNINSSSSSSSTNINVNISEMLKEFLQQQQRMEIQWREEMERRAQERRVLEQEWRQSMEKLERERLMVEQAWREREEQRRAREESRAEKRDMLLTTLLNKLIHE